MHEIRGPVEQFLRVTVRGFSDRLRRSAPRVPFADTAPGFFSVICATSVACDRPRSGMTALDCLYVIRTGVPAATLGSEDAVRTYKRLAQVEQAFGSFKSVDLKVRPIHDRLEKRVRAHVLMCMLAYYVEWHMRQALAPLLFDDHDPAAAEAARPSAVAPAQRSPSAQRKALTRLTADDTPVHGFQTLMSDLATIAKNRILP